MNRNQGIALAIAVANILQITVFQPIDHEPAPIFLDMNLGLNRVWK